MFGTQQKNRGQMAPVFPEARDAGVRIYFPVPVRLEVCGLLLALSLTVNSPVLVPFACGVKVTLIVHLLLAARLVVQVVVDTAKSPVVEIAMLVRAIAWLLLSVNVFAALVVPTAWAA
jgi:hypothetical protein